MMKRHDNQKMAAFNLGVADAVNGKKKTRPLDFHPSYVFQKRPLTPPRFIKQDQYHVDLADQVGVRVKKSAVDEASVWHRGFCLFNNQIIFRITKSYEF